MSMDSAVLNKISKFLGESVAAAMDTLTPILGMQLTTTCKDAEGKSVQNTDYKSISPALYFNMAFSGDINGEAVAVFREVDLSIILKLLMNSDSDEVEFDEMGLGMIKEIMAQLTTAFAEKIGSFIGIDINASISAVMKFTDNSVLTSAFECTETSSVYNMNVQYNVGSVIKGKSIFTFDDQFIKSLSEYFAEAPKPAAQTQRRTPPVASQQNPTSGGPSVNVAPTSFPRFDDSENLDGSAMGGNMDLLMEVPMNVCVEIGKTKKKMKEIMNFTQGTVIAIDKQAGAPVDITVNGQLIARGDVIVIDDNFGVRITELVDSHGSNSK